MSEALCLGATAVLYPEAPEPAPPFCRRCPVQLRCLRDGWAEDFGTWGGLTEWERAEARTRRLTPEGALRAYNRTPIQD